MQPKYINAYTEIAKNTERIMAIIIA